MNKYIVAFISFHDNVLTQEVIYAESEFYAINQKLDYHGDEDTVEGLKQHAFNCDSVVSAFQIVDSSMNVTLVETCGACPEQYDAFDDTGKQVGYLRMRHGHFTVTCPDYGGTVVYDALPEGDGLFEEDERDFYLNAAKDAIKKFYNK